MCLSLGLTRSTRHLPPSPCLIGTPHPVSGSLSLCGLVLSSHSHPGGPQCSKSCSSGTRRRQVVCAIGPPGHCGSLQPSRPADVEPCNTQPCHLPPGKDRRGSWYLAQPLSLLSTWPALPAAGPLPVLPATWNALTHHRV